MGWIGCVRCEKFRCEFIARTCAFAPVQPVLHRVSCSNEILPNTPKHYETHTNMSLGSNGWIGCVRCEKFQNDFMAQTCALIAPVQPILHRVTCSNETQPNAPKHYETQENMRLWSNRVDQVRSLRKILMRTCALIAPVQLILHRVSCSNEILPNTPKHYETHINMSLWSNGGGLGAFVAKNSKTTSWLKLVH